MKKSLSLFLVLLMCLLGACSSQSTESSPQPSASESSSDSGNAPATPEATDTIRIALPDGVCAKVCQSLKTDGTALDLMLNNSSDEVISALSDSSADMALLSTADAVNLFDAQNGGIQCIAVVASQTPDDPTQGDQATECLVVSTAFAKDHQDLINAFLTAYEKEVSKFTADGAFFATSWDMVDAVQNQCEALFSQDPTQIKSIPDDSFYYFPS